MSAAKQIKDSDEARAQDLRALIKRGLKFADAMLVFAEDRTPEELAYVEKAKEKHIHDEGDMEVDDGAIVSDSEDGAYVMAWTWVYDDEAEGES